MKTSETNPQTAHDPRDGADSDVNKKPETAGHEDEQRLAQADAENAAAEPEDATDWSLRDRGTPIHSGAPSRHAPP